MEPRSDFYLDILSKDHDTTRRKFQEEQEEKEKHYKENPISILMRR